MKNQHVFARKFLLERADRLLSELTLRSVRIVVE